MGAFAAVFGLLTHSIVMRAGQNDESESTSTNAGTNANIDSGGSGGGGYSRRGAVGEGEVICKRASDRPTRIAMGLNLGAGICAIAIGVLWLVLSSLGLLGDL
jgi:hypothetical protein